MGNVLFSLPSLGRMLPEAFLDNFDEPKKGIVFRKDGEALDRGLPDYLVMPVSYQSKMKEHFQDVQLIDFGECTCSLASLFRSLTELRNHQHFLLQTLPNCYGLQSRSALPN